MSLYRAVSLTAAARELARSKLDLVRVQEFRWDGEGTVRAGDYNFIYGKEIRIIILEQIFFCIPQNTISSLECGGFCVIVCHTSS